MKKFALASVLSAFCLPLHAADLATQKAAPAAPAPLPRWVGLYVGYNQGFGGGVFDNGVGLTTGAPNGGIYSGGSDRGAGFMTGGQIGYSFQLPERFIGGVETDFQWSNLKASHQSMSLATNPALISNADTRMGIEWFGTARARLGYSLGRMLPYLTAGVAYSQLSLNGTPFLGGGSLSMGSTQQIKVGWVAGGGADFSISKNLSLRSEYLYMSLPGISGYGAGVTIPDAAPLVGSIGTGAIGVHMIRGGMNYRLTDLNVAEDLEEYRPLAAGDINGFLMSGPAQDWTGFHVGANGGYGGDVLKGYTTLIQPVSASAPGVAATSTTSDRTGGFLGGIQLGYSYQLPNRIVLGVETDGQWSGVSGQHESTTLGGPSGVVNVNVRTGLDWFGTTRFRAGVARGDMLPYVTGGVAYGGVTVGGDQFTSGYFSNAANQTRVGWTLGTGADYAVTSNLSFRAEYLYVSLAGMTGVASAVVPTSTMPVVGQFSTGSVTSNVMRLGVNWKFGSRDEAAAAK